MSAEPETNFYKPDENAAGANRGAAKQTAISWTTAEYIEHARGASWYLVLLVGTAALAAAIYLLTKDYFATGVIVVLGIIVAVFAGKKPRQIAIELDNHGIKIGGRSYTYNQFKSFSILHEGPQASVNFLPIKRFSPMVSAYFDPQDENGIKELVGEYLPFEERKAGAVDRLSFKLRL